MLTLVQKISSQYRVTLLVVTHSEEVAHDCEPMPFDARRRDLFVYELMSQFPEIRDALRHATLFQEFTDVELDEFLALLDPKKVEKGECVVRQDDVGDSMYLLVKGSARVVHHREGREVELAKLKAGDFFGELALVDHGPRSADVEATEPCTLLQISQASISALAGVYPSAAFKFLIAIGRILVDRLRQSNRRYIDSLLIQEEGA